jgi:ATP-binding cassette, subfamily C, bacterial
MLKHLITTYDLIVEAFQLYPGRSVTIVASILIASLAEGLGVAAVLPVLGMAASGGGASESELGLIVADAFAALGIPTELRSLLVLMVIGFALKGGLMLVAMQQIGFTSAHISTDLRFALVRAVMGARWSYYSSQPVGVLGNAMTVEATRGGAAFTGAYTIVAMIFQVAIYVGVATVVSWQIAMASLAAGIVMMVILGQFINMTRHASLSASAAFQELLRQLTDALNGIKPLKAMAMQERVALLLEAEASFINKAARRLITAKHGMQWLREPIMVIFLAFGLYATLVVWQIRFEVVLVMTLLFYRTAISIARLQTAYQQVVSSHVYYQRIREKIAAAKAEQENTSGRTAPDLREAVRLEHVSLRLGGKPILTDCSMSIPVGRITTLYGPSGAGKTTLTDLVIGLYRPESGRVFIDEVPLDEIGIASWRREIGYVPQELFLFHDTLLTNVTLGETGITVADAETALKAAGAWEFTSLLADGVHTMVGEKGMTFSGGQRQRIAIARALVRKPKLLILDEPTTSLDPENEAAICATLKELSHGITILAISHQRALLDIADNIYRVFDGRVTLEHTGETSAPLGAVPADADPAIAVSPGNSGPSS